MSRIVTTAVATVGTSLLGNLRRLVRAASFESWLEEQPEGDRRELVAGRRALEEALAAANAGRFEDAGQALALLADSPRVLGAEASSLGALLANPRYQGVRRVVLLHSATADGSGAARAVRALLVARAGLLCDLVAVRELSHDRPDRFKVGGLRNLVSAVARVVREAGAEQVVLDATGGYKAQVAVVAVIGQAFGIPVVYRFEEFPDSIELPPLPVQVDDGMVADHLDLFMLDLAPRAVLEERCGGPLRDGNPAFARLRVCLEGPLTVDGEDVYGISPLGQLLYEHWQLRQEACAPDLPAAGQQRPPCWGQHHRPAGVEAFAERLLEECPWVRRLETRPAAGRSHGGGVSFRLAPGAGRVPTIECTYVSGNHPAVLVLHTTARSAREQEAALRWLHASVARQG